APCCLEVSSETYREIVKEVMMLLRGRTPELIRSVRSEMLEASENQEYETAAVLRDKMIALESVSQKQVAVSSDFKDRDVIALACNSECGVFTLLSVRGGHLQGTRHFDFKETLAQDSELMESFIRQYYEKAHFIPSEIIVQIIPEHIDLLEARLKELHGEKSASFRISAEKRQN
ncbi:MAG: excinuclease ABC subunit C, partial [Desulfobacteraceae bacterium]|nr:excinuclease ABC subunit C [Desulfobacteraceae bacterium]